MRMTPDYLAQKDSADGPKLLLGARRTDVCHPCADGPPRLTMMQYQFYGIAPNGQ
jgi:hypothetical protein